MQEGREENVSSTQASRKIKYINERFRLRETETDRMSLTGYHLFHYFLNDRKENVNGKQEGCEIKSRI